MSRVFISYRRVEPDQTVARLLFHHLSDLDHDVFFDSAGIPIGSYWDKEIAENVRRSECFIPLVSSSYLFSPYIIEKELKVAAKLLSEQKIERILQVNLAFDGEPPDAVREVVSQIQHFKWRSPADTPRLCREIAAQLPSAELLVKGMRPFLTADQKLFSQLGREENIAAFLTQLRGPAPVVVLHGVSGAGKTSFLKAGVAPRLDDTRWTIVELTGNAAASLDAVVAEDCQLLVLDQFEQSLIRFAANDHERLSFEASVNNWIDKVPGRKVIFCLRDEYRTPFDTMLPQLSPLRVYFPLIPLRPDAASRVLGLLLDSVGVKYDADFLPRLCAEYLAENVPKTVLPALLQLLAQYCQNRRTKLDKVTWDRLLSSNSSLFEDHLRESVLERLPRNVSRIDAVESLAALTEADVKSRRKSVREIAEETRLKEQTVSRVLELAAMPNARVVTVEPDAEENRPTYRLVHDLFAPAVLALRREVTRRRDARRRMAVIASLGLLLLVSVVAGLLAWRQSRIAERQRHEAIVRQLVAESNALRSGPRRYLMQSLLLAAEAHRRKPTWQSDAALRAALHLMPLPVAQLAHGSNVVVAKFSPDGQKVLTAGAANDRVEVRVWEIHSTSPPAVLILDRAVKSVAFSDDGSLIAIGAGPTIVGAEKDERVIVWDLKQNVKVVETPMSTPVTEVAFLPGAKRVVAVGPSLARVFADGSAPEVTIDFGSTSTSTHLSANAARVAVANGLAVKVYSVPDGRILLEKKIDEFEDEKITAMAFSRDGTVFAAAASRRSILAWDLATGRLIKEVLSSSVRQSDALALSDDGRLLAHAEYSGLIIVWDLKDPKGGGAWLQPDVRTIQSEAPQMRLAFRNDSDQLMAVTDGLTVRYITLRSNGDKLDERGMTEVFRAVPEARIDSVALSADGAHVVVGDAQGRATVWRLQESWSVVLGVDRMNFSPSGRFLLGRSYEGFDLFDMSNVSRVRSFPRDGSGRGPFALSPDGNMVAIRSEEDDSIDVYESHTGVKRQHLKVEDFVRALAFSGDSRRLKYELSDGQIAETDVGDGAHVNVKIPPSETARMKLSPLGKYVVSENRSSDKRSTTVFEADTGKRVWEFEGDSSFPNFTFSRDERFAAARIDKQNLAAWETDTGRELWRFPVEEDVIQIALGGDAVMAVWRRTEVIVLDLKKKLEIWRFKLDLGRMRDSDLSPDAQHVMVSSTDDKIRIWNIARRELVTMIDDIEVDIARFSPDGKYIVIEGSKPSSYLDKMALLLVWRPQDLIDEACARITHNLTETDWRQFFGGDAYVDAPCGSKPKSLLRSLSL